MKERQQEELKRKMVNYYRYLSNSGMKKQMRQGEQMQKVENYLQNLQDEMARQAYAILRKNYEKGKMGF